VLVMAQPTGVHGFAANPRGLRAWDSERYGSLHIPDEAVSYDIFTQAAWAVGPNRRTLTRGADPMGGLTVKKLIATGASQSGSRITAYINGLQPLTRAFDAIIPAINAGTASDFVSELARAGRDGAATAHTRSIRTRVRDDLSIPVLALNTQTEALFYSGQRQNDTNKFRSWEIAGAAHLSARNSMLSGLKTDRDGISTGFNNFTNQRSGEVDWVQVHDAAVLHIHRWITDGTLPPQAPPIQIDGRDYLFDEHGNVVGGIRLPEVEVPVARYIAAPTIPIAGFTVAFPREKLRQLYPSNEDYAGKITAAAEAARDAGFILPEQVDLYTRMAKAAQIPEEVITEPFVQIRETPEGRTTR